MPSFPLIPAALALFGYLLGSLSPAAYFAGRQGIDLRKVGSGNLGATNAGRALGKRAGRRVLALDLLKGALAPGLALLLAPENQTAMAIGATACVVGHCFPIFYAFRGGKGAASGLGALLIIHPVSGCGALCFALLLRRISGRASVGSIGAALLIVGLGLFLVPSAPLQIAMVSIGALILVQHRDNLLRLYRGEEPPIQEH